MLNSTALSRKAEEIDSIEKAMTLLDLFDKSGSAIIEVRKQGLVIRQTEGGISERVSVDCKIENLSHEVSQFVRRRYYEQLRAVADEITQSCDLPDICCKCFEHATSWCDTTPYCAEHLPKQ